MMNPNEEIAAQWLYDEIRVHLRARREGKRPPEPSDWVGLCWEVGNSLALMASHGISIPPVITAVSEKLRLEFPGVQGLMPADFQKMRSFYLEYFERTEMLPDLRRIPWDRHLIIMEKCKDPAQQEYYLRLCLKENLDREGLLESFSRRRYEMSAMSGSARPD